MSEEKLYAVKNDDGKYWDFLDNSGFWSSEIADFLTTPSKKQAELVADDQGGHIVTFVEEPEKLVLSKEQAEIVEDAHDIEYPANYIAGRTFSSDDEKLIMEAYVNGYTVASEKRYVLPMPGTDYHNNLMHGTVQYYAAKGSGVNWRTDVIALDTDDAVKNGYTVTQSDIDAAPAWVKAITPVEVTDDGNETKRIAERLSGEEGNE